MKALEGPAALAACFADPPAHAWWKPLPVLCPADEVDRLGEVCRSHGVTVFDTLAAQVAELARVHHPAAGASRERASFCAERGEGGPHPAGKTWMYFHWSRRLVRVLDGEDYFAVITSRNQDKITRAEQETLRGRTVGVVGLSVGAEIAVALAQEHLCGRLRVADFDDLELSNLNRLGSGIQDLGVNKAWLAARRIAEIDPWLEVEVFPAGLTEENAPIFLEGLDLLVDECDSLGLKVRLREWARERRLNVLFAADERGMLSIEPYAHADIPLFHGRLAGPQGTRADYASDLDFFRSLAEWLGGWDALSTRSRQSLSRIGVDLAGYPQLAGEPRFAAGQVACAARRLLLGEKLPPFFGFQDPDQWIGGSGVG